MAYELMTRFTTILGAAARFIGPAVSHEIAVDVKVCFVQAILRSLRSIETVQSWMVICRHVYLTADDTWMCFWKDPEDRCGWTHAGLLCRLAVEMGFD